MQILQNLLSKVSFKGAYSVKKVFLFNSRQFCEEKQLKNLQRIQKFQKRVILDGKTYKKILIKEPPQDQSNEDREENNFPNRYNQNHPVGHSKKI